MQRRQPKYENDIEYWQCCGCKEWISRDGYYHYPQMWNGITSRCKKCHRKSVVRTRDPKNTARINKAYYARLKERHPERIATWYAVSNAIRDGKLKRGLCEVCGIIGEAHHEDYFKTFDIRWFCREHHYLFHMEKRRVANVG